MELWDLYDAWQQPMNKLQMWGKPIPEGCCHIVVFIWIFTYDGKLLLTRRDACKPGGLLWEVIGGFVLRGEASREEAKRELYEETDISCRVERLQELHTRIKEQGIYDYCLLQCPVELDKLQLRKKETIGTILADQSAFEDVMWVYILAHPPQLRYHELKDTFTVYFRKNR